MFKLIIRNSILHRLASSLIIFLSFLTFGQNKIEVHTIERGNQEYLLKVSLPEKFDVKKNYSVLYYLDAWHLSDIVTGSYKVLNRGDYVKDIVLVGISIEGDELEYNTRRTKDFTPSKFKTVLLNDSIDLKVTYKSGLGENGVQLMPETTGGAGDFAKFLSDNLFPFVEKEYPNLTKKKGLLGHSFGGLFGTFLMQQNPDLIDDYLLISGSLFWNESELLKRISFKDLENSSKNHQLFLTYGTSELKLITESNKELNKIINSLKKDNLNYQFEPYVNANHHSILSRAIYDGILFLYKK